MDKANFLKAPPKCSKKFYVPDRESERIYLRLEPQNLVLVKFILEAIDNLVIMSVVDRYAAVIRLSFPPSLGADVEIIIQEHLTGIALKIFPVP